MKKRVLSLILILALACGLFAVPAAAAEELNAATAWALLETYIAGQKDILRYFYVDFNNDGIPELVAKKSVGQTTHYGSRQTNYGFYVYYVSGGTVKAATGFKTATRCGPGTNDKYAFDGSMRNVTSRVVLGRLTNNTYIFVTEFFDGEKMIEEGCTGYYDGNGVFKRLQAYEGSYQNYTREWGVTQSWYPDNISTYQLFKQPVEVVFITNGGSEVDSYVGSNGEAIQTVPANPVREGWSFGGWYADEALTVPWNFTYPTYNGLKLYAKWDPATSTATTVRDSSQLVTLNGKRIDLNTIVLPADVNGGDVTYARIRDMAALLDGTAAQFNVDWANGAIQVATQTPYTTRNGTELEHVERAGDTYEVNTMPVLFDGQAVSLEGIVLTDVHGGGHTYFKLRDLGAAVGLHVDWTAEGGIILNTPES